MKIIIYLIFQYGPMLKLCPVVHLGFLIDTKTHTFCKGPSEEHSSYDFCQMFKKKRKKRSLPCGDCLLGFFFPIETP